LMFSDVDFFFLLIEITIVFFLNFILKIKLNKKIKKKSRHFIGGA
jgi:hypothetical protein